jgi:hypothetical protein
LAFGESGVDQYSVIFFIEFKSLCLVERIKPILAEFFSFFFIDISIVKFNFFFFIKAFSEKVFNILLIVAFFQAFEPFLRILVVLFFIFRIIFSKPSGFSLNVPLRSEHRFNNIFRPGADSDFHFIFCFSFKQLKFFQVLYDLNSAVKSHHSLIFSTILINSTIIIQNVHKF